MEQKPLKIEEGRIKQFSTSDNLPNQDEVEELKELVKLLTKELVDIGIPLKSEKLIKLCQL